MYRDGARYSTILLVSWPGESQFTNEVKKLKDVDKISGKYLNPISESPCRNGGHRRDIKDVFTD
jgi:hypothetical protein